MASVRPLVPRRSPDGTSRNDDDARGAVAHLCGLQAGYCHVWPEDVARSRESRRRTVGRCRRGSGVDRFRDSDCEKAAWRHRHRAHCGHLVGAWHLLPNIWSSRAAAGELPMPAYIAATAIGVFVGYLTGFRLLMVWVYEHTRSLFVAMLMHVSLTASLLTLNPLAIAGAPLQVYSFALAAVVWLVSVMAVRRYSKHPADGRAGDSLPT